MEIAHKSRNFGLDVFRTIAILLVVLFHGNFYLNGTILEGFPYVSFFDGVDIFFVLSGYLIGGIILNDFNKSDKINPSTILHFYKRRWWRTLPNYYLILFLTIFLSSKVWIDSNITFFNWKYFFFLQNFYSGFQGFFWESWSLSVEEWFYLIFPVLIFIAFKFLNFKKTYLISLFLMILFSIIFKIFKFDPKLELYWIDVSIKKVVLCRLDSIALGLLAAYFFKFHKLQWIKFRWHLFLAGIGFSILILFLKKSGFAFLSQVVIPFLSPFSAFLILPLFQSFSKTNKIIAAIFSFLSRISYSMYLLNLGIILGLMNHFFKSINSSNGILFYCFYLFNVVLSSTLLYYCFERPILKLRDKFNP